MGRIKGLEGVDEVLEVGEDISANTTSHIDLHSKPGSDYDLRILKNSGTGSALIENIDSSELELKSGGDLKFTTNSAERWTIDASTGHLVSNTSQTIRTNSADASDTNSLFLTGGGAFGSTRGAFIQLAGNESGDTGGIHIGAGNVSGGDIRFDTGGSTRWVMQDTGYLEPFSDVSMKIGSSTKALLEVWSNQVLARAGNDLSFFSQTGQDINFYTGGSLRWLVDSSGNLEPFGNGTKSIGNTSSPNLLLSVNTLNVKCANNPIEIGTTTNHSVNVVQNGVNRWTFHNGGDLIAHTANTALAIRSNTSDGTDNGVMYLCGGGGANQIRGAYIELFGNEQATAGRLSLVSGNAGDVKLFTANQILFEAGGTSRWKILSDGTLESTAGHSIYSNRYETNTSVELNSGSSTDQVRFAQGGNLRWYLDSAGTLSYDTGSGNIVSARIDVDNITIDGNDITGTTSHMKFGPTGNAEVHLITQNTVRWYVSGGVGHLIPNVHNTVDLGTTSNRVRDIYTVGAVTTFTGSHLYKLPTTNIPQEGDCVKLVNKVLEKCDSDNDPKCIGVLTSKTFIMNDGTDPDNDLSSVEDSFGDVYNYTGTNDPDFALVASVGDARCSGLVGAKICDSGGAVADGDLLCSSATKPGFLMKQSDDIVHSYTVAQARESVTFDGNGEATGVYIYLLK